MDVLEPCSEVRHAGKSTTQIRSESDFTGQGAVEYD